jgi:uncharacterized UBP type Zn finger protein
MMSGYHIVFTVEVTHTYFEHGFCKGLHFQPSQATDMLIHRFGFTYVITKKGLQFYAKRKQDLIGFLNYVLDVADKPYFEFLVSTDNDNFYQFTDLPLDELGLLVYSSKDVKERETLVMTANFEPVAEANCLFSFESLL